MLKFNKEVKTSVLEQLKSGLIIALIVGIASFYLGIKYQSNAKITVDNHIVVSATEPTEAKK